MKSKHTRRASANMAEQPYVDLAKVDATTEADIERHAREDGDVEWTPDMLRRSHVFRPRKKSIHIMIDPDILAFFQREGRGYQSRINGVLRSYVDAHEGDVPHRPRKAS